MTPIEWIKELEMGDSTIDAQHRTLIKKLGEFMDARRRGPRPESLREILDFLAHYVSLHFHDEEKLMLDCRYPDYAAHKSAHKDFLRDLARLEESLGEDGPINERLERVEELLRRLLVHHICTLDRALASFRRTAS